MRGVRLALGITAVIFAILYESILLGFGGGIMLLGGILNLGCDSSGCKVNTRRRQ